MQMQMAAFRPFHFRGLGLASGIPQLKKRSKAQGAVFLIARKFFSGFSSGSWAGPGHTTAPPQQGKREAHIKGRQENK
jgi:hypothetical protein